MRYLNLIPKCALSQIMVDTFFEMQFLSSHGNNATQVYHTKLHKLLSLPKLC